MAEKTDGIFCSNDGYECQIRDSEGKVLPPVEIGQIFVKSPDLMIGYLSFVSLFRMIFHVYRF